MRTLIDDLRANLAAGSCLCSSAHTDWRGVEDLLDRLEAAEAKVAAVEALADEWGTEGPSLIRHAHSGGDVYEGETLERCARALRAALGEA